VNFDRIAPVYALLEAIVFRAAMQEARTEFLYYVRGCRRALIAGEGNGRFLEALLNDNGHVAIDCVDSSAKMIELARARIRDDSQLARVRFIRQDLLTWCPSDHYDLIVTNFFLDCFDDAELQVVIENLAATVAPGGKWLVAEFDRARSHLSRVGGAAVVALMYAFFRVATHISGSRLLDYRPLLSSRGFHRMERRTFLRGLVVSEVWGRGD